MALRIILICCSLLLVAPCVAQVEAVEGDDLAKLFEGEDLPLLCNHVGHSNNVTLRGGINAGKFTKRENATSLDDCIEECCRDEGCDVAFELEHACYSVNCFSAKLCEVVPNSNPATAGSLRIAKIIHNAFNETLDDAVDKQTDLEPTLKPKSTKTDRVDSVDKQTDLGAVRQPTFKPKHTKTETVDSADKQTDLGAVQQPTHKPKHTGTDDKQTKSRANIKSSHNPTVKPAKGFLERQTDRQTGGKAYRKPGQLIREKVVNDASIPTDAPATKQGMTKVTNRETEKQQTTATLQTLKPETRDTKKQPFKQTLQPPSKPMVKQTGGPTDTPTTKETQATKQTATQTDKQTDTQTATQTETTKYKDDMAKKNKVPANRLRGNNTCLFSRVAYNQTITGGIHSWQSIDLGDFIDLHDCAERCCRTDNCMVAAVRENKCFAVECFEKTYCQSKRVLQPTAVEAGGALNALIYMNIVNSVRQKIIDSCNVEKCVDGICTNDDTCLCDTGVKGIHCDEGETDGKCDPPCGQNGQCNSFDRCQCKPGWEGYKCDRQIICDPPCRNGNCVDSVQRRCECRIGWSGQHCNRTTGDKAVLASTGEQVLFTHFEIEPELAIKIPANAPPSSSRGSEPVSAITVASCCGLASMFILIFVVVTKTRQNRMLRRQYLEAKKNAIKKSKF